MLIMLISFLKSFFSMLYFLYLELSDNVEIYKNSLNEINKTKVILKIKIIFISIIKTTLIWLIYKYIYMHNFFLKIGLSTRCWFIENSQCSATGDRARENAVGGCGRSSN